ncbi:tyrosine-type recombinase/integrase [Deinococcus ficus]|uniref:tyrosine-type recombinase/integrase n=1 Tax=Deinococcus ficus TaxID=317577 RepID=UPI0004178096|nr:site-specific integrase [Deinococcus ficus]
MTNKATTPQKKARKTKERGNGQGSVYAYKGGPSHRWLLTIGVLPNGRPRRIGGIEPNKTLALKALRRAQQDLERGLLSVPSQVTLGEWLKVWLKGRQPEVAETTFYQYELYVRLYIPEELTRMKVQEIKRTHLQNLSADLAARGLKAATRSKVFQHLRSAFREAVDQELIVVNPAEGLRVRATATERLEKRPKALTDQELERFLTVAEGDRLYPLIYALFALGLRRGEALGLRWTDVDFRVQSIRVEQQVKLLGNTPIIGALKTANSRRTVYFGADLLDVLQGWRARQLGERKQAGSAWEDSGLVFTTALGSLLDPHNVNRTLRRLSKEAGVRSFGSHTGRYTNITNRLRAGQPLEVVSAIAGHANPSITLDAYRDVLEDEKRTHTFDLRQHRANVVAHAQA